MIHFLDSVPPSHPQSYVLCFEVVSDVLEDGGIFENFLPIGGFQPAVVVRWDLHMPSVR